MKLREALNRSGPFKPFMMQMARAKTANKIILFVLKDPKPYFILYDLAQESKTKAYLSESDNIDSGELTALFEYGVRMDDKANWEPVK